MNDSEKNEWKKANENIKEWLMRCLYMDSMEHKSELHNKILDNMDAEVKEIEKDVIYLQRKRHPAMRPEERGFLFKLKKVFSR